MHKLFYNVLLCFPHYRYTTSNYQQFLALTFAISQVNKDFFLLPNITLGFHIYGHFQRDLYISLNSLSMLSSRGQVVPGYKCHQQDSLLSVIGGLSAKSSRLMASIFRIFKFPQGHQPYNRRVYPSFFRINPNESPQYVGLIQLLLYFQWNWVGLLAPEDDRGECFISTLAPMLKEKEICLAFTLMLELDNVEITQNKFILNFLTWSKAEVFIMFGHSTVINNVAGAVHLFEKFTKVSFRNLCIFTSHWKLGKGKSEEILQYIKPLHGVLHFRDHSGDVSEFSRFLLSLDPLNPQGDFFLPLWWELVFGCKIHKSGKIPPKGEKHCTGKENLQNLPNYIFEKRMTGDSYNIYNAVYALAHALHAILEVPHMNFFSS
uniref:Receptor ligand binding region domain-containing protein n=1 Tax=Laticauda laticaudata TaxID=8630 RepID=A0A8C5RVL1_LATLA